MSAAPLPYAQLDRRRDRGDRADRALTFITGVVFAWSIVSALLLRLILE